MFSKCQQCGFYIRQNDEFCLNCGELDKTNKSIWQNYKISIISGVSISIIIFFLLSFFSKNVDIIPFILLSITIGFMVFLVISIVYYESRNEKIREKFSNSTLQFKEKTITKRIAEISKRKNEINSVLSKIDENSSQNLLEIRQKLLSAREIIDNQFSRYEVQKNKIELVRLQNKISPYLENVDILNDFDIENGINQSEKTTSEITELKEKINSNLSEKINDEQQNLLNQLEESTKSCEKLREVLLSKKAFRALQGIQPIEDIEANLKTKELSEAAEIFNLQSTLNDFSESFEQLESEYKRLLADNEVSQKLLNYEN